MLGLVEHSSKDSHHSVTKATERNTQKAFYEKLASLIDKYTQNHIMYYFFVFTCKRRVMRKLQAPSTIHQRNLKTMLLLWCFLSANFAPVRVRVNHMIIGHNFWKPLFSKCFPSTLKCNADIFKFPWFEDHFRKVLFSVRISVDDRPI